MSACDAHTVSHFVSASLGSHYAIIEAYQVVEGSDFGLFPSEWVVAVLMLHLIPLHLLMLGFLWLFTPLRLVTERWRDGFSQRCLL